MTLTPGEGVTFSADRMVRILFVMSGGAYDGTWKRDGAW